MNKGKSRTTEISIGGTVYVIEAIECDTAKESAYFKIKRLITANAKSLIKSDIPNNLMKIYSTSSK